MAGPGTAPGSPRSCAAPTRVGHGPGAHSPSRTAQLPQSHAWPQRRPKQSGRAGTLVQGGGPRAARVLPKTVPPAADREPTSCHDDRPLLPGRSVLCTGAEPRPGVSQEPWGCPRLGQDSGPVGDRSPFSCRMGWACLKAVRSRLPLPCSPGPWFPRSHRAGGPAESLRGHHRPEDLQLPLQLLPHGPNALCWLPGGQDRLLPGRSPGCRCSSRVGAGRWAGTLGKPLPGKPLPAVAGL